MTLFDQAEADRRAEEGIARAAERRGRLLAIAQQIARDACLAQGEVTSDDIAAEMDRMGEDYAALGNASGAVFRGIGLRWTGRCVKSARPSTHGRVIRVWELDR